MARDAVACELRDGRLEIALGSRARLTGVLGFVRQEGVAEPHEGGDWYPVGDWGASGGRLEADCGPMRLILDLACVDGVVRLRTRAVANEAASLLEVGVSAAVQISARPPAAVLCNGYQSWDPAAAVAAERFRESWWTCGLTGGAASGVAMSAVSADRWAVAFAPRLGRTSIVCRAAPALAERPVMWTASAGDTWTGEEVVVAAGADVTALLRRLLPPGPANRPVPRGWLSWYHHGPWVSAHDVRANAAALVDGPLAGLGYDHVQLDDGWQEAYGDWHPNTKFGASLAPLCAELSGRGLTPGLWTAPFLVSAGADLAATAPDDWFMRDGTTGDRAVDPRHTVYGPMLILDARRAGVQHHLEDTFRRLREDGFLYFKIDFLYAGAYPGLDALRAGVQAIRRGAGADVYILACGAPLLPMVGLADGCRIGQDTATPIYDFESGAPRPAIFGDEVAWVARNIAARACWGASFQPDPDVALVGGNLSLGQARQLVTAVALSGGPFFASDDLGSLPDERLALLTNRAVLALAAGAPARPDWDVSGEDRPPSVWRAGDVIALFNWTQEPRRVGAAIARHVRALDLWEGIELGAFDGAIELEVPASDVRLIALRTG